VDRERERERERERAQSREMFFFKRERKKKMRASDSYFRAADVMTVLAANCRALAAARSDDLSNIAQPPVRCDRREDDQYARNNNRINQFGRE